MITKEQHNEAAIHLLDAMNLGGGMADRIRRLLTSLIESGERDSPNIGALFAFADAKNKAALLTLFDGWQRYGVPEALDKWRIHRYLTSQVNVQNEIEHNGEK